MATRPGPKGPASENANRDRLGAGANGVRGQRGGRADDLSTPATSSAGTERQERERLTAENLALRALSAEIIESMPLGFVALDDVFRVTYANPMALMLTGMLLAEIAGRRPWDLFPQIVGTRHQAVRASAGIIVEYEERFAKSDRWVGVLGCRSETGVAVFLRDLTAQKVAEEAGRSSVALLHGSLDAMADSCMVCSSVRDTHGTIVDFRVDFANTVAGSMMGRAPDSLIGAVIPLKMPDLHGIGFLDVCRAVVETGQAWTGDAVEHAVPDPDGGTRRGALSIQVAKFGDGFFTVWRDVTETERARLQSERLAVIVEEAPDGIVVTEAAGRIEYANPAFAAVFGRGIGDFVGMSLPDTMLSVIGRDTVTDIDRTIATGDRWLGEVDTRDAAGTARRLEISVAPSLDSDGVVSSTVSVFRDVTKLHAAEALLDVEARMRVALADTLHAVHPDATLDEAAQAICDELVKLPFIDVAAVEAFLGNDDVQVIGLAAPSGYPVSAGEYLPAYRAAIVREGAQRGPWAHYAADDPADGGWIASFSRVGLRAAAYGPIVHGDHVAGALVIGTYDDGFARMLVEQMPAFASVSTTSSALLAHRLHLRRREADLHEGLASVLASGSFHPVFQPIVDLESSEIVGYEGLTRFDSGQRPDLCFADAWSVGLGPDLEIATLEAAVAAAKGLPSGRWLDLNISPALLTDAGRLRGCLWPAARPVVLEITEHDVIEDYGAVRDALWALGRDVRVAVDDAGAGVANFGHIIELRPDFVKLDISLVRRVNANLGRQAMVVGMRHFSRTTGCRLIAEGIETEDEARTLLGLGVEFGQGYYFGYPEPVEVLADA